MRGPTPAGQLRFQLCCSLSGRQTKAHQCGRPHISSRDQGENAQPGLWTSPSSLPPLWQSLGSHSPTSCRNDPSSWSHGRQSRCTEEAGHVPTEARACPQHGTLANGDGGGCGSMPLALTADTLSKAWGSMSYKEAPTRP